MKIFAENFRGFKGVEVDLEKITFLVGDNSSGKSSLLHLIDSVARCSLNRPPRLNEELGVSEYDYFSPYFDYSDVVFGFSAGEGGEAFSKMITVKHRQDDGPTITRCSYLFGDVFISLKKSKNGILRRIERNVSIDGFYDLIKIHKANANFRGTRSIPGRVSLGDPGALFTVIDPDDIDRDDLISMVFSLEELNVRLISPIRALPERFYSASRKISAHGLHFAPMLNDISENETSTFFEDSVRFGIESGLFDRIFVRKVSGRVQNSPLIVSVEKSGKEFFLNQVGVGVSQIAPVLVEMGFAMSSTPPAKLLVQQPELHLHPVAQAAFGSFLFKAAEKGLRGVFETHSSFIMDRFRSEVRDSVPKSGDASDKTFLSSDISILFCVNGEGGNIAYEISVDERGKLRGEPEQFHGFFIDEMLRTMH